MRNGKSEMGQARLGRTAKVSVEEAFVSLRIALLIPDHQEFEVAHPVDYSEGHSFHRPKRGRHPLGEDRRDVRHRNRVWSIAPFRILLLPPANRRVLDRREVFGDVDDVVSNYL